MCVCIYCITVTNWNTNPWRIRVKWDANGRFLRKIAPSVPGDDLVAANSSTFGGISNPNNAKDQKCMTRMPRIPPNIQPEGHKSLFFQWFQNLAAYFGPKLIAGLLRSQRLNLWKWQQKHGQWREFPERLWGLLLPVLLVKLGLSRKKWNLIPSHLEHTFPHQNSHKLAVNPPKNPPDLNPLPASEKASS